MDSEHPCTLTEHIDDVVSDVEALTRLHGVRSRCERPESDFEGCLGAILDTAIFVTGAGKGTLHLLDLDAGVLMIRAQRGFQQPFLDLLPQSKHETAAALSAALDAAAARQAGDVPHGDGVRAVHSTPLISSSERVYGMISAHFARPTPLGPRKQQLIDKLAREAADYLERKQSELLLARLASGTGTLISECSGDMRYLFVNERYADFLRRPVELIVGHSMASVLGESAFEVIRPYVDRVLAGARVEYDTWIPYADPGLRHMHVVYVPGFDLEGSVCGWIETVNEITEERRETSASRRPARCWHMRQAGAQACRSTWGGRPDSPA